MKNLLVFHLDNDWGEDLHLIANNQRDLEDYIIKELEAKDVEFNDLDASYGTCSYKTQYGRETAKCFYAKYI